MPASGIRGTHDIPLGSHLCLFYRQPTEFLQIAAGFLKAGLTEQELCLWVLPPPLTVPEALKELSHYSLDGLRLQSTKQLQISSAEDWYCDGAFDVERSLNQLVVLPAMARELGYATVRAVGGPGPFRSDAARQAFMRYEDQLTAVIAQLPFIGLCCYSSIACLETDMLDIMGAHPRALLHTHTGWASI